MSRGTWRRSGWRELDSLRKVIEVSGGGSVSVSELTMFLHSFCAGFVPCWPRQWKGQPEEGKQILMRMLPCCELLFQSYVGLVVAG